MLAVHDLITFHGDRPYAPDHTVRCHRLTDPNLLLHSFHLEFILLRLTVFRSAALPADAHRLVLSPWDVLGVKAMKENRCCKWKGCVALHAVPNEHRVAELRFVLICSFRSGKIEVPVINPGKERSDVSGSNALRSHVSSPELTE